ncbi:NADP-dependent 3-hydroxy acid dehydrogenase YdfG [Deinobacterium chartae]|uniref:NADP-dependent 3-hydroxy acid dehydrogenase YdfG n=1 Tax=Deinobacterium chartae TaxID=521158 RepID=A0A841HY72_9DEIO|nr:SDR family oxidoreductase [Deinobacterium chartae]MBB6098491.1 NADP-dependent 3-hydroxy acid dehydrogenase YdfG [Deinobacterium chartae]
MPYTALITGATGGIGHALARALEVWKPDVHLVLLGRHPRRLEELRARFPRAQVSAADLLDPAELSDLVETLPQLDLLVHSAGAVTLGRIEEVELGAWREMLDANLLVPALLTRAALPQLRRSQGDVVFVNSGAGLRANPGWGGYAASKFAARALADALRLEEPQLRVISVFPGRVATEMQRQVREMEGGDYTPEAYLRPEDVAATIVHALQLPRPATTQEIVLRANPL